MKLKQQASAAAPAGAAYTVAIVGTGLIGASAGLALRAASSRTRVVGFDKNPGAARVAKARGALSRLASSLEDAVADADVVLLAVPLAAVIKLLPRVMQVARAGSLVLDAAGLKAPVVRAAAGLLKTRPRLAFVGGHPMAGLERAGPQHATPALFQERPFALCAPAQPKRAEALRRAKLFVRTLGSTPVHLEASQHDRIVAATSGLPQVAASAVALAVGAVAGRTKLTGPGYDSVTRLARSPATLWRNALLANRRNILRTLTVFESRVKGLREAIERGNPDSLSRLLRSAAAAQRRTKST